VTIQGKRAEKIQSESGEVDLRKENVFVINAPGAPAADGFCSLEIVGEEKHRTRELYQNKHVKNTISKDLYLNEYQKSAMKQDVFILFTTHDATLIAEDLPARGGIVSKANFQDYFGPFAARAFCEIKIGINQATRTQLEAMSGVGPTTAGKILNERKRAGNFKDREDFKTRLNMGRTLSDAFVFPERNTEDRNKIE
jgi:DNA uptake protein ComE-like DNA-binding protein